MARMPRLVVPGYPHHVTQRGNRKLPTFFCDEDYRVYIEMAADMKERSGVELWAYCLMPNHVHYVVVPLDVTGLSTFMQHLHRRYARRINRREDWQGHLWQERFYSVPMDEHHLMAAVRYIERNPVDAMLCGKASDWRWSSVHAHLRGEDDTLVTVQPMLERVSDWPGYLAGESDADALKNLRDNARCGRPAGNATFVDELEAVTGRRIRKKKPGPPRRTSYEQKESNSHATCPQQISLPHGQEGDK